jgi:dihydroorotase
MDFLEIKQPDDWHVHFRDEHFLRRTAPDTARIFGRAIAMPNLKSPITTVAAALDYRQRIIANCGVSTFNPLMTLYLTEKTSVEEIEAAAKSQLIHGLKLYPAGATTNSDAGVRDISRIDHVLQAMSDLNLPLLIHGEVVDSSVDVFDREAVFLHRHLDPLISKYPKLRVVLEHITTKDAVAFVEKGPDTLAATITAHHLHITRSDLFQGGIRPHLYCLPIAKRREHRDALIGAATSGNERFFLGSDSAPHAQSTKECAAGCAGIYTAPLALEWYAQAFDQAGALDRLEGFASIFGAKFYQLPVNTLTVSLRRKSQEVPLTLEFGRETLIPFQGTAPLMWTARMSSRGTAV